MLPLEVTPTPPEAENNPSANTNEPETVQPIAAETPTPEPTTPSTEPTETVALESTTAEAMPTSPEEVGLANLITGTLQVVRRKYWLFFGVTILNFILFGLLYIVGIPVTVIAGLTLGKAGMYGGFLLLGLITLLLSYMFYGSMAHQAASVLHNEDTSFGESLSVVFKKVGAFLELCVRMVIYSRIWLVLVVLALWGVTMKAGGVIGVSGILIASYLLGLFGLLSVIYSMIRAVRLLLAIPALMSYANISAKEALLVSVEMTHSRWWMTVSFVTVFGFLLSVIPAAVNFLASITGSSFVQLLAVVSTAIFAILSYAGYISFLQVMTDRFGDRDKNVTLNIGVLIGAIVIMLLPLLLIIAAPLLGIMALKNAGFNTPTAIEEVEVDVMDSFVIPDDENAEEVMMEEAMMEEAMMEDESIPMEGEEESLESASTADDSAGQTEQTDTKPRLPKLPSQ